MDHLDTQCMKMLTGILTGGQLKRYKMTTAVLEAWQKSMAYRLDFAQSTDNTSVDGFVWKRHSDFNDKRPINDRVRRGYSIHSVADGWTWIADSLPDKKIPLKRHMELLKIGPVNEVDMVKLTIETPAFTTPEGKDLHAESFTGWLFDPKNHFWRD